MRPREQGFTLVELMIAMVIGVFLVAGIVQVLVGSKRTFEAVMAQSHMQESGRFALTFIAKTARLAGYNTVVSPNEMSDAGYIDISWPATATFQSIAPVSGMNNVGGGAPFAKAGTDVFSVRMQGDDDLQIFNCDGIVVQPAVENTAMFFISANDELRCQTADGTVTLVDNVQDMQIQYGEAIPVAGAVGTDSPTSTEYEYPATDPDFAGKKIYVTTVNQYVNADDVTDWANVVAVRVAVLAASQNTPFDPTADTPDLLDNIGATTYTDGRARRVFTQTIMLRNQTLRPQPL